MTVFLEQVLIYLMAYLLITSFCGIFLLSHKVEKTFKVLLGYEIAINQFYKILRIIVYTIPKYTVVFLLFLTPTPIWGISLLFLAFNIHLMIAMIKNYTNVQSYIQEHHNESIKTILNYLTNHIYTYNFGRIFLIRSVVDFLFFLTLIIIHIHFFKILELVI